MTELTNSRQANLNSLIENSVKSALRDLHTTTPGIIEKFDPATGRAEIQPAIQCVIRPGTEDQLVTLPKLINCPIGNLKAGGFVITMPVKPGDECLIHFTERSLDAWIKFGDIRGPNDIRMHHISDAYFIPCTTSEPNVTSNYDPDNMVLRNTDNTLKMVFDTSGNLNIEAIASVTMTAPTVAINGNLTVTGTSTADDHISGTISGKTHGHPTAPMGPISSPINTPFPPPGPGTGEDHIHPIPPGTDASGGLSGAPQDP